MPKSVVVMDSAKGDTNLSDEAYAAFKDSGVVTQTPAISGKRFFTLAKTATRVPVTKKQAEADGAGALDADELAVILEPVPRVRKRRRPSKATVKEELSKAEVEEMLADTTGWKLAVLNGSSTDVLTRDKLQEAWDKDASGEVQTTLRGVTPDEQALLDHAKESMTPKAGATRFTAALGAPVTNIALLASAAGLFLALKPEDPRPWLLILAGLLGAAAVIMSLLGTNLLRNSTVQLSRLDLLAKRPGPPVWLSNLSVVALAAAIVAAVCAVAFPKDSPPDPAVKFGKETVSQAGRLSKVDFTVSWTDLGDDVKAVETTVTSTGRPDRVTLTPKDSDGNVTQQLTARVASGSTIVVSTQAVGAKRLPVGDMTTHTYAVP